MAKAFYRLQRLLRQAQLLFLFLGVAYIMAGSVLLLQRSNVALFQKGNSSPLSFRPIPQSPDAPSVRRKHGKRGPAVQEAEAHPDRSGSRAEKERLANRNLKIRHLRRHWTQGQRPDRETSQRALSNRDTRHKGTYLGCFVNDDKQHALGGTVFYDFRKMTSTLCQDTCYESGYSFAGLEYGTECHCGNRISAARARSEDCNLNCRSERDALCGGVSRLSIYKVDEGIPGQRRYRNVHYHGCFHTPKNISADFVLHAGHPNLTSQLCVETCTDQERPLAVLRGRDCLCGFTSTLLLTQQNVDEQLCERKPTQNYTPVADYSQVYSTPILESLCRARMFRPESSIYLTALSSFPGAGNTWLRHLVELATGFYTGSYYFDGSLYNKGFKGEKDSWQSGRTICVKTHESGQREITKFDSAILLIRNPYHCLVAEFNRKNAGHLGYAADTHWKSNEWPEFVETYSSWWVSHALAWLQFSRHLLVVHYELLLTDLVQQLRLITAFLNVTVPEERLVCAERNRDGQFKRAGSRRLAFDPFTADMRTRINGYVLEVDRAFRDRNLSGLPQEYMPR